MRSIRELRTTLKVNPHEINSQIKYFSEKVEIDFNVYLPTKKMDLQRALVWDIEQKRELIWSVLMNRNIPRMAMINTLDNIYQVIDGKQRLSTMIEFYKNDFPIMIDSKLYYCNELPIDYQRVIGGYHFAYYIVNEEYIGQITDQDKIDWFMYINFAGTPQDKKHFNKLNKLNK